MKKKKKLRQIFFSFSPFGTYSVSFWLCIALPVYLLSFFLLFSFGNIFLRILRLYAIFRGIGYFVCPLSVSRDFFFLENLRSKKKKQKEHRF
jgi:hypothetical protein